MDIVGMLNGYCGNVNRDCGNIEEIVGILNRDCGNANRDCGTIEWRLWDY